MEQFYEATDLFDQFESEKRNEVFAIHFRL